MKHERSNRESRICYLILGLVTLATFAATPAAAAGHQAVDEAVADIRDGGNICFSDVRPCFDDGVLEARPVQIILGIVDAVIEGGEELVDWLDETVLDVVAGTVLCMVEDEPIAHWDRCL